MNALSIRRFGLTPEEAAALLGARDAVMPAVDLVVSSHDYEYPERMAKSLRKADLTEEQMDLYLAAIHLRTWKAENFQPMVFERKLDDGRFVSHESFGAVDRTDSSSNEPSFVGTPTLETTSVSVHLKRATMRSDDGRQGQISISSRNELVHLSLAAEQFAQLLRDTHTESPCALTRFDGFLVDVPPRLVNSVSIAKKAQAEANALVEPVIMAVRALNAYIQSEEKISTKANYAELQRLGQAVRDAMQTAVEPLKALLYMTAGEMATSSQRQLLQEITEPLIQLGMDGASLLKMLQ